MKRVTLSTWVTCTETGVRLEKGTMAYQDEETRQYYCPNSDTVRVWLTSSEGHAIANGEEALKEG